MDRIARFRRCDTATLHMTQFAWWPSQYYVTCSQCKELCDELNRLRYWRDQITCAIQLLRRIIHAQCCRQFVRRDETFVHYGRSQRTKCVTWVANQRLITQILIGIVKFTDVHVHSNRIPKNVVVYYVGRHTFCIFAHYHGQSGATFDFDSTSR